MAAASPALLAIFKSNEISLRDGNIHSTMEYLIKAKDEQSKLQILLECILTQIEQLAKTSTHSTSNIKDFLSLISRCLGSDFPSTCSLACRILTRFCNNVRSLVDKNTWKIIYKFFIAVGSVFDMCMKCMDKHTIDRSIMAVVEQFVTEDLKHFFVTYLGKNPAQNTLFIHKLLDYIDISPSSHSIMETVDIPLELANLLINGLDSSATIDTKIQIFYCISFIHCKYPKVCGQQLIPVVKKGCHDINPSVKLACISCLFDITETFSADDIHGLELFRFLALSVLENYGDMPELFVQKNFIRLLETFPRISTGSLVAPLIRFLKSNNRIKNTDIDLLLAFSRHAGIDGIHAIHLFEYLWTIATSHLFYGQAAIVVILALVNRLHATLIDVLKPNLALSEKQLQKGPDSAEALLTFNLITALYCLGHSDICKEIKNFTSSSTDGNNELIKRLLLYVHHQ